MQLFLVLGSIILIMASVLFNFSMLLAFVISISVSYLYFVIKGYKITTLNSMIWKGVYESRIVFLLILLMGLVISSWMASGIVPGMIYYGFDFVNKGNFLLNCFLISMFSAFFMGTALGCFSTIGMALFCLGQGLQIPAHIMLGAITSGCFIADKMSPISSLTNLLINVNNIDYKYFMKSLMKTIIPTLIITVGVYYILGHRYSTGIDANMLLAYKNELGKQYVISLLFFLVPIILMVLSILGIKTIKNLSISIIISSGIALIVQKIPFMEYVNILLWGYNGGDVLDLKDLIKGGGFFSMFEVFLIVLSAVILSTIFIETGTLERLVGKFFDGCRNYFSLIFRTVVFSSLLTISTCDQTCSIIIPSKFLKNKFNNLSSNRALLARTISDSGVIIAPLMNWNVNSIVIYSITGVSAVMYAPYTVLCYVAPIITLIVAFIESKTLRKEVNHEK